MNRIIKGLLASIIACTSFSAQAATSLQSGSTFIAHRDELANIGMEWTNSNHLAAKKADKDCNQVDAKNPRADKNQPAKKCANPFGASLTATGFYGESTNATDLAYRFGIGASGAIKITKDTPTATNLDDAIYGLNIHHSPNSDGITLATKADADDDTTAYDRVPMNGTLKFAPKRQVYGANLGWTQSLDGLLKGLSFSVRAPIVQVRASMNASTSGAQASSIPTTDGKSGVGLLDYFGGKLTTDIATYIDVSQAALTKNIIDSRHETTTGVADIEMGLKYAFKCCTVKGLALSLGVVAQIPTGNKPNGARLFEPIYGARGHVAAGANGAVHFEAFSSKDLNVEFDILANYKYFCKGTEVRTMGIYDLTSKSMIPASQYRLLMRHGVTGVTPAANILTLEHDVTPGHQVDALAGMCISWKNFTFDLGYNLFWHAREKVVQKAAWSNDTYALAHNHYSMRTSALGNDITGGTSYLDGDENINHNGYVARGNDDDGDYNDTRSAATKHGYAIGNAGDAGSATTNVVIGYGAIADDDVYPGAFTSINGPIQKAGASTSALAKRATADTGLGSDTTGTLTVSYNVSSLPAITDTQITHSVVGGITYKFSGDYPMIIGVGGQGEFQESGRNSALEGFKVWAKFGISF